MENSLNFVCISAGSKKLKTPLPAERKTIKLNWRSSSSSNKRQKTRLEKWRISWNKQHLTGKITKLNYLEMMEGSVLWNLKSLELKLRRMIPNSSCQAFTRSFADHSAYDRSPDLRLQTRVVRRKTVVLSEGDLDRVQVNRVWISHA